MSTPNIEIRCGYFALGHELKRGLTLTPEINEKKLTVLLDAPFGFAMNELAKAYCACSVVITDNPCGEYWEDLWEMKPQVLLARGTLLAEIQMSLEQAARGNSFRQTPEVQHRLSASERINKEGGYSRFAEPLIAGFSEPSCIRFMPDGSEAYVCDRSWNAVYRLELEHRD